MRCTRGFREAPSRAAPLRAPRLRAHSNVERQAPRADHAAVRFCSISLFWAMRLLFSSASFLIFSSLFFCFASFFASSAFTSAKAFAKSSLSVHGLS
eukprot:2373453-Alexandrium_andersonii.AAC.1